MVWLLNFDKVLLRFIGNYFEFVEFLVNFLVHNSNVQYGACSMLRVCVGAWYMKNPWFGWSRFVITLIISCEITEPITLLLRLNSHDHILSRSFAISSKTSVSRNASWPFYRINSSIFYFAYKKSSFCSPLKISCKKRLVRSIF